MIKSTHRKKSSLFPVCYVWIDDAEADSKISHTAPVKVPAVRIDAPSASPIAQWTNEKSKVLRDYVKSWYFPYNAFDPWPKKTSLRCWWCTCTFDWTPFPLPHKYSTTHRQWQSIGVFCGPSCAKAYALDGDRFSNSANICVWINQIATEYYGYTIGGGCDGEPYKSNIAPAPQKEILREYCGDQGLDIEQYRSLCHCGRTIKVLPPGWITSRQVMQAEQTYARKNKTVYHADDPDHMQRTEDLVKVRRIPYAGLRGRRLCDYYAKKV